MFSVYWVVASTCQTRPVSHQVPRSKEREGKAQTAITGPTKAKKKRFNFLSGMTEFSLSLAPLHFMPARYGNMRIRNHKLSSLALIIPVATRLSLGWVRLQLPELIMKTIFLFILPLLHSEELYRRKNVTRWEGMAVVSPTLCLFWDDGKTYLMILIFSLHTCDLCVISLSAAIRK